MVGLRDRALLGVMAYTFARIGAVVSLTPQDYFQVGKRSLIRFREKGGKEKEIPVHHKLEEYLDAYLSAAKLSEQPARLRDAGLSTIYSNHSFRAAGITNYLENDGTLEVAQRIAGHADSRTTKLSDRRGQKVLLEDMERIHY